MNPIRTLPIRTIGHSNHPIERFVALLRAAGIERVIDVRSTPWSRRFPQFGREALAGALAAAGIDYRHEGAALGGKPANGAGYEALAARPAFAAALDRLADESHDRALCLMCAEKDPLDCHRTVLVARRLAERGLAVEHLLADGGRLGHGALEERLLGPGDDLFAAATPREQRLAEAWRQRERAMKRSG
jgi:uncharacterized protein (DUF488 family)